MIIKFTTTLSGPEYTYHPGQEIDAQESVKLGKFSETEIKNLLETGICEPVQRKVETAYKKGAK
jgi:hypothetical protein